MRPYHISNTQVLESKADCVNRKGLGYTDTAGSDLFPPGGDICDDFILMSNITEYGLSMG